MIPQAIVTKKREVGYKYSQILTTVYVPATICNRPTQHMAYADNVMILSRTINVPSQTLQEQVGIAKIWDVEINEEKTKYMMTWLRERRRDNDILFLNLSMKPLNI